MYLILFAIIFLLYALDHAIHKSVSGRLIDLIPGPKYYPLIGNSLDYLGSPASFFARMRNSAAQFDGIYKLWIVHKRNVNIYNPEDIEIILSSTKHITKSFFYNFLHPWLNTGLLTSTGTKWHQRRKVLTPAFHFNILNQFCKIFTEHSEKLTEKLKKTNGRDVDILPFVTDFALNSICETAMGTNLDSDDKSAVEYKNAIYKIGEIVIYRLVRVWFHIKYVFNMSRAGAEQRSVLKTLHGFTMEVIKRRREEKVLSSDKFVAEDMTEERVGKLKKRLAMLDLLLSAESEGKIDEDGIREEVDTFMFEGHDTTTMAITFCLMLLANNPEAQKLIVEEVESIMGDRRTATMEDLNNMKYLERCIKEALRLYPSVHYIGRHIKEDLQLHKYVIPANTTCHIHIYDLHRNPKLYPNPHKFDPDRFLPENCTSRHAFAYIPFSAGPRNCIGQRFAILEEKAVISTILREFILEPITRPDDIIFSTDIILRTVSQIKMKFIPRHS